MEFTVSTDRSRLQIERIHEFLSKSAYWCLGIPRATLERAIQNSICFGVFGQENDREVQVGFARIVSDQATFAWLCDVYIEERFRGLGLAEKLLEAIRIHPATQGLRRFCLTTRDAHGLYRKSGFEVTQTPESWMEIKASDVYRRKTP